MKILLITPRNKSNFWTFDGSLPVIKRDCLIFNLSMPTLAGLTPPEHEVVLCDENVEEIDFDTSADVVGVTGYLVHKERMLKIVREFRRRGRYVVVGGPYASLCPEDLREHCDTLFIGEAEETWPQFLHDFAAGKPQAEYQQTEKTDMTRTPVPRFDLLKLDRYQVATIQTGRGCPFRCEFCDIIIVYGRRPRTKKPEQVLAEIEECHRLGMRQIFIADDNFIGDKKQTKVLLREMGRWGRERGYPLAFATELSVNVAEDDELLELMRQANMTTVFLGIESPREASLLETKKTQNTRANLVDQVHKIQSYGIQVQAGMIVGFDNDDPSIFAEQLAFIQQARIPTVMLGMLQAFPRTPLYERVQAERRLISEADRHYRLGFSNIEPAGMTRLELYRGYRDLIRQVYSVHRYDERVRAFLFSRGEQVERQRNYRLEDFRGLGQFLLALLVRQPRDRARFAFRLLIDVLLKRPKAFREAGSFVIIYWGIAQFVDRLVEELDGAIEDLEREQSKAA